MSTAPSAPPFQSIDELISREKCAAWFGESERWVQENVKGFRPSHKCTVYHPRTILAKMAFDAGVPLQIIAASYGVVEPKKHETNWSISHAHHD